jgi:hypothetical protein
MQEIRALSATGILGSGFREDTLKRAMALKPDFIGADAGSTDPGPHYLGSGESQFSDSACKRDLRLPSSSPPSAASRTRATSSASWPRAGSSRSQTLRGSMPG